MIGTNRRVTLLAFALAAGVTRPAAGQVLEGRPVFDVTAYGAKRDGSTPATEAFARAIAAAKAAGGGTVFVPAGQYQSGPIELASHLRLEFDAGAVVAFPAQMLPLTKGRQQGVETLTPVPLIGGHDLEDVQVVGPGTLVTSQADWTKSHGREQATATSLGSANGDNWEKLLLGPGSSQDDSGGGVQGNVGTAIDVTNFYMMEGETKESRVAMPKSATTPAFENIAIDGVTVDGAKMLIDVDGLPESPIEGLRISDVIGTGTSGAHLVHASGMELHDVQFNVDKGPAFLVEDCPEAEFDHIASRRLARDEPVLRIEGSEGSIVRSCATAARFPAWAAGCWSRRGRRNPGRSRPRV